jgi:predicted Zn-dependent protease
MNRRQTFVAGATAALLALAIPAAAFDLGSAVGVLQKVNPGRVVENAKNLRGMSQEDEIALGQKLAAKLLGAAPLSKSKELQRYVNRVGRWVAMQTERPDLPWTFGVLDSDAINAFAVPGGYVFVTEGLLRNMKSESELAGVLAHEVSHVVEKHHLKALQKAAGLGLVSEVAVASIDSGTSRMAVDKVVNAGTELYARGLDKGDEYAADRAGVVVAARAGYEPYGLVAVLHTLEQLGSADSRMALLFKTHPSPTDRLSRLEQAMGEHLDAYAGQPQLEARLRKHLGKG